MDKLRFIIPLLILIYIQSSLAYKDDFDEFMHNPKNKELIDKYYSKNGIRTQSQLLEKLKENGVTISKRTLTNYLTKLKVGLMVLNPE